MFNVMQGVHHRDPGVPGEGPGAFERGWWRVGARGGHELGVRGWCSTRSMICLVSWHAHWDGSGVCSVFGSHASTLPFRCRSRTHFAAHCASCAQTMSAPVAVVAAVRRCVCTEQICARRRADKAIRRVVCVVCLSCAPCRPQGQSNGRHTQLESPLPPLSPPSRNHTFSPPL